MRKIKNYVGLLLAFLMVFSTVISPAALTVENGDNIAGIHESRAIVIGKASDYANELVAVMLLKGDGTDASASDILYMDTVQADSEGYYELKIKYNGFEIEDGKAKDCVIRVRAGSEDITDSVLSATVNQTEMLAVEIAHSFEENSANVVAGINNLYGKSQNTLVMLAAYDDFNKLIGVKTVEELIDEESEQISVAYENLPSYNRLVAYVWESATSLIPYAEEKSLVIENKIKDLVINPGSDETKRRFAWYNDQQLYGAKLQYALKADYERDGGFTEYNSTEVTGTTEIPYNNTVDLSCKAEIEGLELGTEYVYRVGNALTYSDDVYSFKTYDIEKDGKQSFVIVSDIHMTMKNHESLTEETPAKRIKYINNIYKSIFTQYPDLQFIISCGDNMTIGGMGYSDYETNWEHYLVKQELELDEHLTIDKYKTVPFISATGNHETVKIGQPYGGVTRYHYNLPNDDGVRGAYTNTNQHGNWWFRNGDVLIIGILLHKSTSTGAYVNVTPAVNEAYIKEAVEANPDAKWRIIINHVPAYSSVVHTNEEHTVRNLFASLNLDAYDIDAVISGHQHTFSRSKHLLTNKYDDTEYLEYTNTSGTAISLMKPKIVSEDAIEHGTDENGYQVDIATDPEGTVHIDVPSLTNGGHDCLVPDFKDFINAHGVTNLSEMIYPDGTSAVADASDAIEYSPSSSLIVTVEENDDGSEQIKFEFVKNNATNSNYSETGTLLDTYIIKKTK